MTFISGTRWYRAYPTPLTQLVVADQKQLWFGKDPTIPAAPILTGGAFTAQNTQGPVTFCSARDPNANNGNGSDVLIICGFTGPYGYATGQYVLAGTPTKGQVITLTLTNGANVVTPATYTVLPTDNLQAVAQSLIQNINVSIAVTKGNPFLNFATYSTDATTGNVMIQLYALNSGVAGNSITYSAAITGSGMTITPTVATHLTGGGASVTAPLKYDGNTISGLSGQIQQPFTGCFTWHNHVWFWGDPNHPDELYAADINQPEGFSFMLKNGPYEVGPGDGDPSIRACIDGGNAMYVFKGNNIYEVTGYDFQGGEYQFQIEPKVRGHGTPNAFSVAKLRNAIVFWDGEQFCRYQPGGFDVEMIGRTIPRTSGLVAQGNQALVRAVGGSFITESLLNENFYTTGPTAQEMYSNVALFAVDVIGDHSAAKTVLVYDDDASQFLGNYAWSIWNGWSVGCWIPFGGGPNNSGAVEEPPILCFGFDTPTGPQINQYGSNPTADSGNPIPWIAQTGWVTLGTAIKMKELHGVYLETEAAVNVAFAVDVTASTTIRQKSVPKAGSTPAVQKPNVQYFAPTVAPPGTEAHQTVVADINPFIKGNAFLFRYQESSATADFEVVEQSLDVIENPFTS